MTTRSEDAVVRARVAKLADSRATIETDCERAFLVRLGGGCTVPAGALARLEGDRVRMHTFLAPPDGSAVLEDRGEADARDAADLGRELAERLLEGGGREWVPAAKEADRG